MKDAQKSPLISTDLRQIAAQAKQEPTKVFTSLAHRMDIKFLTEAYHRVRKDGATGLSGVTSKEYAKNLSHNLNELHQRLKTQTYVAPKIKRVWIDKGNGKKRPIGITEFEDKIAQKRSRCYSEQCMSKTSTTTPTDSEKDTVPTKPLLIFEPTVWEATSNG